MLFSLAREEEGLREGLPLACGLHRSRALKRTQELPEGVPLLPRLTAARKGQGGLGGQLPSGRSQVRSRRVAAKCSGAAVR